MPVDDPYHYASAAELALFRRPLPTTNLKFDSTVRMRALACGRAGRAAVRSRELMITPRAVTAPTTIAPPSTAHGLGRSPNVIATYTGDRIGSMIEISVASIAVAWQIAHA